MTDAPDRMTQGQASDYLGVSRRRILALEKEGRLKRGTDKLYSRVQLDAVRNSFDPKRVAAHHLGRQRRAKAKEPEVRTLPTKDNAPNEDAPFNGGGGAMTANELDQSNRVYLKARSHKSAFEAKTAELKYRQLAGDLVDAKQAKMTSFVIARKVRQKLQNLPARIGHYLDEDGKVALQKEVREMIDEMLADVARI